MLSTIQIIIHLSIFLIIVLYKKKCSPCGFRLSAGLLAFAIAGFNLASVGYLVLIQPKHALLVEYLGIASSTAILCIVAKFKGNTSKMIDWVLKKPVQ